MISCQPDPPGPGSKDRILCALCRETLEPWVGPFHPWCKSMMVCLKALIGEPPKHEGVCDRCRRSPIEEWIFMIRKGEVFRVCLTCAPEILVFHEPIRKPVETKQPEPQGEQK